MPSRRQAARRLTLETSLGLGEQLGLTHDELDSSGLLVWAGSHA